MSKTIVWIVVAVVVIAAVAYYVASRDDAGTPAEEETVQDVEETGDGTAGGSFRQLLTSRTPQECTFEDASSGTQGTVYVASGKMRGDFRSTANNQTTNSHMIVDGNTFYTWVDGMNTGFKMSVDATAQGNAGVQGQADLDRQVDYDCNAASVSSSRFDLPAGVTFTSIGGAGVQ